MGDVTSPGCEMDAGHSPRNTARLLSGPRLRVRRGPLEAGLFHGTAACNRRQDLRVAALVYLAVDAHVGLTTSLKPVETRAAIERVGARATLHQIVSEVVVLADDVVPLASGE